MYSITRTTFENINVFPYIEGNHLEFKGGFESRKSIYRSMCAFLNNGGGHIIIGINDESHRIIGIKTDRKDIDKYLLSIDNLIRNGMIQTTYGKTLSENEITSEVIPWSDKWVIVHTVRPKPDTKYQFSSGEIVVRLNASNQTYSMKSPYVSYGEIERITLNHQKELFELIKGTQAVIYGVEKKKMEAEVRCAELTMLLHRQIMREKEIAEDRIDVGKGQKGLFTSLLCGLW